MGTLVTVTAIHESSGLAQDAAEEAFREMDRVVDLLNRYDSSSALSYLNVEGVIPDPPSELADVMGQARYFHDASGGAFDSTVQPLVDLFRGRVGAEPTPSKIEDALSLVDGGRVEMNGKGIRLGIPGMGVTLDGIAKGYVVDRMADILGRKGLKDFLINAGGDIRSAGFREDGEEWRVGVQDPAKAGNLPDVFGLSNVAVATSGSYEIYFDPDRTYHHIVSAREGRSPRISQSVSVIAPTTLAADALATSVFVMGPDRGIRFIETFPQCACLVVDEDGRHWRSKGWRSATDVPNP
jgi:thiamine biosynthesis lipoprotein